MQEELWSNLDPRNGGSILFVKPIFHKDFYMMKMDITIVALLFLSLIAFKQTDDLTWRITSFMQVYVYVKK